MAKELYYKIQAIRKTWYMQLCVSKYLTSNKDPFVGKVKAKYRDYTNISGQTLQIKSSGIIAISFTNGIVKLESIAYAPDCNRNLISLRQFCKNNIIIIDNKDHIKLIQREQEIAQTKRDCNLLVLQLATPNKVM